MGLCKCPQRKVSTLFCFKHHVNVCESCLVNEHPSCIVRSYVSWLQDNDFNPNCSFCQRSLSDTGEETIRLVCYDLFHWSCLNEYFQSFPSHTAPDGYTCPICHACIFPPTNLVSPVADRVRTKLAEASWANRLPLVSTTSTEKSNLLTETEKNGYVIVDPTTSTRVDSSSGLSHHPHRAIDMTMNSSSPSTTMKIEHSDPDEEDKYKRRSVFTWFARWLKSRQNHRGGKSTSNLSNRNQTSSTRTTCYLILAILFVFITLITVLYHLTRGDNNEHFNLESDPQFNPFNNPFIRVGGRFLKNPLKDSAAPPPQDSGQS